MLIMHGKEQRNKQSNKQGNNQKTLGDFCRVFSLQLFFFTASLLP